MDDLMECDIRNEALFVEIGNLNDYVSQLEADLAMVEAANAQYATKNLALVEALDDCVDECGGECGGAAGGHEHVLHAQVLGVAALEAATLAADAVAEDLPAEEDFGDGIDLFLSHA